ERLGRRPHASLECRDVLERLGGQARREAVVRYPIERASRRELVSTVPGDERRENDRRSLVLQLTNHARPHWFGRFVDSRSSRSWRSSSFRFATMSLGAS